MKSLQSNQAPKNRQSVFSIRQRLLPVILVSLAVSLTLFVFGPFEIYSGNRAHFGFSMTDFLGWSLLYALGAAGVICAIQIGRAHV